MADILIVDDEPVHCDSLQLFLEENGHRVSIASSAEQAFDLVEQTPFRALLLDIRLPGLDGLSAIPRLRSRLGEAPIIVMTAFGTLDTAMESLKLGVFEYLIKPFSLSDLRGVLRRALASEATAPADPVTPAPPAGDAEAPAIIGTSPAMQRIFNQIAMVASTDVPVLITGESGTGKEIVAQTIHRYSRRGGSRFVPVLLAALSPGLIESELFGHARGSYTGAESHRTGLLEQAAGGTVLLDELGDIPLSLQVKLLRAIEQREVSRVGEDQPRRIDARFLAATNRSLPDLIARGLFREDLYYRLGVYHIELPPLRDRREDIPELARHFLSRVSALHPSRGFSSAAMDELLNRPWRGNVRELRNAVEHAALVSRGTLIAPSHLPLPLGGLPLRPSGSGVSMRSEVERWLKERIASEDPQTWKARLHGELLTEVEDDLIELTMRLCQDNQSAACRVLGVDPKTLRSKLATASLKRWT